jgi:hypothetical protein
VSRGGCERELSEISGGNLHATMIAPGPVVRVFAEKELAVAPPARKVKRCKSARRASGL